MKDMPESESDDKTRFNEENNVERFTFSLLGKQILQFFNFESGVLRTLKLLVVNPGEHIRAYLSSDRERLINPFKFYLVTGTVFVFLYRYVFSEEQLEVTVDSELEQEFFLLLFQYYHFFLLFIVFFIAFYSYLLFRKESGFNMIENLILNLYITGVLFVIVIVTSPLEGYFQPYASIFISVISFFYFLYAYTSFYSGKHLKTITKTVLAILFGMGTFLFVTILSGFIVGFLQAMSQT